MSFLREEVTEDSEECRGTHLRGLKSGMSLIRKKGQVLEIDGCSRREQYFWGHFRVGNYVASWVRGGGWKQTSLCLNSGLANCSVYDPGLVI